MHTLPVSNERCLVCSLAVGLKQLSSYEFLGCNITMNCTLLTHHIHQLLYSQMPPKFHLLEIVHAHVKDVLSSPSDVLRALSLGPETGKTKIVSTFSLTYSVLPVAFD